MGGTTSIPQDSPLGDILHHWKCFDPDDLRKKQLIFYCNNAWPQYELGDSEQWPLNGSQNYNTILPLDLYFRKLGKLLEVSYVLNFHGPIPIITTMPRQDSMRDLMELPQIPVP